jgi:hypothetical protein
MGLIELIVTVCALSLRSQCEEIHFSFSAGMPSFSTYHRWHSF